LYILISTLTLLTFSELHQNFLTEKVQVFIEQSKLTMNKKNERWWCHVMGVFVWSHFAEASPKR